MLVLTKNLSKILQKQFNPNFISDCYGLEPNFDVFKELKYFKKISIIHKYAKQTPQHLSLSLLILFLYCQTESSK